MIWNGKRIDLLRQMYCSTGMLLSCCRKRTQLQQQEGETEDRELLQQQEGETEDRKTERCDDVTRGATFNFGR
jgi:UTP:GlnB (protein PII) uridylyltransferase